MEEEGQIYKTASDFLIFAQGHNCDLSKFNDDFTPFFDFERPLLSPWSKINKLEAAVCSHEHDKQFCQVS